MNGRLNFYYMNASACILPSYAFSCVNDQNLNDQKSGDCE